MCAWGAQIWRCPRADVAWNQGKSFQRKPLGSTLDIENSRDEAIALSRIHQESPRLRRPEYMRSRVNGKQDFSKSFENRAPWKNSSETLKRNRERKRCRFAERYPVDWAKRRERTKLFANASTGSSDLRPEEVSTPKFEEVAKSLSTSFAVPKAPTNGERPCRKVSNDCIISALGCSTLI